MLNLQEFINDSWIMDNKDLSLKYKMKISDIQTLLRENHINIQSKVRLINPRDSYYFSKIDTQDKAYWLGFFYADGCVDKQKKRIRIMLKDGEHIEKFKIAIKAPQLTVSPYINRQNEQPVTYYRFDLWDTQLHQDLISLGCLPNKSMINFHFPFDAMPEKYYNSFIRGYFDGDGWIIEDSRKYKYCQIGFIGPIKFLQDISNIIDCHKQKFQQNSTTNDITYKFSIGSQEDVERVLKYMYTNSTENTVLNRKFEKAFQFLLKRDKQRRGEQL